MSTKYKHNLSNFVFGLMIILFVSACQLAQAQVSQNDIVYQRNEPGSFSDIYSMKADGSNQTNLTNSAESESFPDWSPDGSRIVFSRSTGIWMMNADGSNQIQLTTVASDTYPAWSPSGGKIAFQRTGVGSIDIYVMNADGSNQTRLTTAGASNEQNGQPE